MTTESRRPPTLLVALAFAAVYVIWGSTYLAIRVAVETLPALTSAGARFLFAGTLMYLWCRRRGIPAPTRTQWRAAAIVGGLLLLGGNGCVVVAEQTLDSNIAALLVATVPLWLVLLNALRPGGQWPNWADVAGLLAGFAGIFVLFGLGTADAQAHVDVFAAGLILFASLSWATGSLYSRAAPLPRAQLMAVAAEMIGGGMLLVVAGAIRGEWFGLDPATFSARSLLALAYLVAFGSIVAFTAYMWLLQVSTPTKVGTYAYVNPVVAVFLGWSILGEKIPPTTVLAMLLIVAAVALISTLGRRAAKAPPPEIRPAPLVADETV